MMSSFSRPPNRYNPETKARYLKICQALREIRADLNDSNKRALILLSLQAQALRGEVPKKWASMANRGK